MEDAAKTKFKQHSVAALGIVSEAFARGLKRLFMLLIAASALAIVILAIQNSEILQFFLGLVCLIAFIVMVGLPKKWEWF